MAFAASTCWDVRTTGSDSNGGGFDLNSSNFATDGTVDTNTGNTASPVFSSASYNFVAGDVGHWLYVKAGTNCTPGLYQIASVASNKATLSAAAGAGYLVYTGGTNNNMPYGVTTAAGIATVGTPTGITWGIDYSQSNAAAISYTDMVIDATTNTKYTSAANPCGKNLVGNVINVTSGTGFTVQRVQVVSVTGTTATCDKSLGTLGSTGGNGAMGGALASWGMAGSLIINNNSVMFKSGTYTQTTGTANVSGGAFSSARSGTNGTTQQFYNGWSTLRHVNNTEGAFATLTNNTYTSFTQFAMSGTYSTVRNLAVNGNSQTSVAGFSITNAGNTFYNVKASNCTNTGFLVSGTLIVCVGLQVTGCATATAVSLGGTGHYSNVEVWSNTITGITLSGTNGGLSLSNVLVYSNTGASTDGISMTTSCRVKNCVAYGNGRHGVNITATGPVALENVICENNSGYGYTTSTGGHILQNCGAYNNTSGDYLTTAGYFVAIGFVSNTTGSFFTNAAAGDFSLNNTANQGALARATGFPGAFPRGLTTGYADIGAAQHADPVAATSTAIVFV